MFKIIFQFRSVIFIALILNLNITFCSNKNFSNRYLTTFGLVYNYKTQRESSSLIKGDFNGDSIDDLAVLSDEKVKLFYQKQDTIGFIPMIYDISDDIKTGMYSKFKKDRFALFALIVNDPPEIQVYSATQFPSKKIRWRKKIDGRFENMLLNDLDGDKKTDIILFGKKQLGITFYRGKGDGSFREPKTLFGEYSFDNVSIANLHSNNFPDFIGYSWLTNQTLVFAGIGKLNFSPPFIIDHADEPKVLAISSIDDDIFPDLILGYKNKISFYNGDGAGGFVQGESKTLNETVSDMVIGDCNKDGVNDIVTASFDTKSVRVLLNNRKGQITENIPFYGGESISKLLLFKNPKSKINNLAILDSENRSLKILYNAEIKNVSNNVTQYSVGVEPSSLLIEDINNDGLEDIIVSNQQSKSFSLFINEPDKFIKGQISFDLPGKPSELNLCRNKDNNIIIVTSDQFSNKIITAELNPRTLSLRSFAVPVHNSSCVVAVYPENNNNGLQIISFEKNINVKSSTLHSYSRISENRFVEKSLSPTPCRSLVAACLPSSDTFGNKILIYASAESNSGKIELYKTVISKENDIVKANVWFTIDSVNTTNIRLFPVSSENPPTKYLVVSLGEPENKFYIFYGRNDYYYDTSSSGLGYSILPSRSDKFELYDINDDGTADFIYYDRKNKSMLVRYSKNKIFSQETHYLAHAEDLSDFKVEDLDNDGHPELILAESRNGLIKIIRLKE